jgi:hypothetical protein
MAGRGLDGLAPVWPPDPLPPLAEADELEDAPDEGIGGTVVRFGRHAVLAASTAASAHSAEYRQMACASGRDMLDHILSRTIENSDPRVPGC